MEDENEPDFSSVVESNGFLTKVAILITCLFYLYLSG